MKTQKEKLFEYAVIYYPDEEQRKNGEKAEVIVHPMTLLAKDAQTAQMKAVKSIPSSYDDRLDQIDIAIRPF